MEFASSTTLSYESRSIDANQRLADPPDIEH